MSEVAVMPMADYVGACDSIREKTSENAVIKSGELAEQVRKVYSAGQSSMVDPTKIIEKTASGIGSVAVDDVSEIPHEIKVQLSSDTITDFSGGKVTRYGKNLFDRNNANIIDGYFTGTSIVGSNLTKTIYLPCAPNTTYTASKIASARFYIGFTTTLPNALVKVENAVGKGSGNPTVVTSTSPADAKYLVVWCYHKNYDANITFEQILDSLQIEVSGVQTEYEPYNAETYATNADGTVEGVTSLSPYMTLQSDIEGVGISMTYHKSWGMQTEWDRFWDSCQERGNKTAYNSAFFGSSWNDTTFKPKYDLKPIKANKMFSLCGVTDLEKILNKCGVVLDFSNSTDVMECFSRSDITVLPELSITLNDTTAMFYSSKVETIRKFTATENVTFNSTFSGCSKLKNITFGGTIANSISFDQATTLSKASILSIFTVLSDTSTNLKLTLNKSAVSTAFETSNGTADGSESEEWLNLVATKPNWTISLA